MADLYKSGAAMPRKPESRRVIEQILWDPRFNPADYQLAYLHRGVQGERKTVPLSRVLNVRGSWLTFRDEEGLEVKIPLHRVLEVRNVKTGRVLWSKA